MATSKPFKHYGRKEYATTCARPYDVLKFEEGRKKNGNLYRLHVTKAEIDLIVLMFIGQVDQKEAEKLEKLIQKQSFFRREKSDYIYELAESLVRKRTCCPLGRRFF